MFGMSLFEILTILTLGLVFLGPEKLPPLARQIGRLMRQLRRASDEIRQTLEMEGLRDDMRRQFEDVRKLKDDLTLDPYSMIRKEEQAWRDTLSGTVDPHKGQPWEDPHQGDHAQAEDEHQELEAHAPYEDDWHAPAAPVVTSSANVVVLPDQDGRPRALDPHMRAQPLPERIGWGSTDASIDLVTLPAVPTGLLVEVSAVPVEGGPREVALQRAGHSRQPRALSEAVQAVPLAPRLWGSKRSRGAALKAVSLSGAQASFKARRVPLPQVALTAPAQEEAS
jgi:Tat protein translocase TatB subunit